MDARLFKRADSAHAIVIRMSSADFRKEPAGRLEVMIIAGESRSFEAVGYALAGNHAERGVGPDLAAGLHSFETSAEFIENGTFGEPAPGRHDSKPADVVVVCFICGFEHGVSIDQIVAR